MPRPTKNLLGQRFGKLLVIGRYASLPNGDGVRWMCRCDCGTEKPIRASTLLNGDSTTCGCARIREQYHDLAGQRFGRLVAIEVRPLDGRARRPWLCQCDCGEKTVVLSLNLKAGRTTSCGCYSREVHSARMRAWAGHRRGPTHYMWRADRTDEERAKRRSAEDVQWSKRVMERDGFKCLACGKGGRLQAHHLEPYATHPSLRLDMNNGATLCKPCHRAFHNSCGYFGFSRTDFYAYFGFDRAVAA